MKNFDGKFILRYIRKNKIIEFSFHMFSTGLPTGYQQKNRLNVNKYKIHKHSCGKD